MDVASHSDTRIDNELKKGGEEMADTMGKVRNRMQDASNQFGQAAENAAEDVKSIANDVGNRTKEWVADAAKRAEDVGTYLNEKADEVTSAVGCRLKAAGEAVSSASAVVGQSLEETGTYLEQQGVEGIANDVAVIVRKNPIISLVFGIALGFLVARSLFQNK